MKTPILAWADRPCLPLTSMLSFLVFSISILLSTSAQSQQSLERYCAKSMYLQAGKYIKNGKSYPTGFLGGKMKKEMENSRDAMLAFTQFEKGRNLSMTLSLVAVGAVISSTFVDNSNLRGGMLLGGLSSLLIALPISFNSSDNLQKAIWCRNRDILR